jgi:hypothetical protein
MFYSDVNFYEDLYFDLCFWHNYVRRFDVMMATEIILSLLKFYLWLANNKMLMKEIFLCSFGLILFKPELLWATSRFLLKASFNVYSPQYKMSKIEATSTTFSFVKTVLNKRKRYAGCLNVRHFILGECTSMIHRISLDAYTYSLVDRGVSSPSPLLLMVFCNKLCVLTPFWYLLWWLCAVAPARGSSPPWLTATPTSDVFCNRNKTPTC